MFFLFLLAGILGVQTPGDEAPLVDFRVIVHVTNPTEALPRDEVARMFRRQAQRWRDWADEPRVEPVDQRLSSPLRVSFTRQVHGWSLTRLRTYWQRKIFAGRGVPPPIRDSDEEVIEFVSRMSGGIGYVHAETPLPRTVKELKLKD